MKAGVWILVVLTGFCGGCGEGATGPGTSDAGSSTPGTDGASSSGTPDGASSSGTPDGASSSGTPDGASSSGLQDKPGPSNTGVPAGTQLTSYAGPSTITTPGTVVDSVSYGGTLTVSAANVTVRRSQIDHILVRATNHVLVEDVTAHGIAVSGSTFVTVQRADICCGNDSMDVTSDTGRAQDVLVQDNYVHDPSPSPLAHYDGIQVRGVDRLTIRHNTFSLGVWQTTYNSAVYLENANGGDFDVTVDGNWLDGGGFTLFVSATNLTVTNNRFGRLYHWGVCRNNGTGPFAQSGNVWDDTGAALQLCP